jgi:hypothetical protein
MENLKCCLIRMHINPFETLGTCFVTDFKNNSIMMFSTMEPIKSFPSGIYTVVKVQASMKIKYPHFLLLNVPNHEGICIHVGNFAHGSQLDTLGCILVGNGYKDINGDGVPDLVNSLLIWNKFYNLMPDSFRLQVL